MHYGSFSKMLPANRNPVALLVFLLAITSHAQRSGIGIKAGPQLNTYRAINIRTTMLPGFSAGAYFPIPAAARLEVQPEILLSMMGTGFIEPDGDRSAIRSLYVHAPVTAKYYLTGEMNLQGGVQLGKLLVAQQADKDGVTDVRDRIKSFDSGWLLGAGYDLRSGLDFTVRYFSGMPTLFKDDDALFPRSRSLQFTIGKRIVQLKRPHSSRRRR